MTQVRAVNKSFLKTFNYLKYRKFFLRKKQS